MFLSFDSYFRKMRFTLALIVFVLFTITTFGQFVTNGSAFATGSNCFTLTPPVNTQLGSVWATSTIDLTQSFDLNFTMSFGANDGGADGNCFILQPTGTNVLGIGGGGMGFEGIPVGFAVEFDSYTNGSPNNDPWYDHIAFLKNGVVNHGSANNLAGPVQANATNANIEDNASHQVRMVWNAPTMTFSCYFDCNLRLSATIDMVNSIFLGNPIVYYGFAGSTGGLNNLQTVCLPSSVNPLVPPQPICEGSILTLNAPANAASNIQWEPAGIIDNPNAATINAILTSDTTFTISYSDLCGIPHQYSVLATTLPYPTIIVPADSIVCDNSVLTLNAQVSGTYTNMIWTTNTGTITSGQTTTAPTVSGAGTYTYTAFNGTCSVNDVVLVSELQYPIATWSDSVYFCTGESIVLDPFSNATAFSWNIDGSTSPTLTINSGGNYSVSLYNDFCATAESIVANEVAPPTLYLGQDQFLCISETATINSNLTGLWNTNVISNQITTTTSGPYFQSLNTLGCISADTVNITFQFPPIVSLGNDTTICEGTILNLNAGAPGTWNIGNLATVLPVSSPGSYSVIVNDGVCTSLDSIDIFMDYAPLDVLPDSLTRCSDIRITLNAGENLAETYSWSTSETSTSIIPSESGTYTLTATNYCGTRTETIEILYEKCEFTLFVPNSFTPNNDGINDVWFPVFDQLNEVEITVFDRWGETVFTGNKQNFFWAGNVRGGDYYAPNGTYSYKILYKSQFGDDEIIFGHITLSR
jgi:gliding motility-associated-like protein